MGIPALLVLITGQALYEYTYVFFFPARIISDSSMHYDADCQLQALITEWVYVMVLVIHAELAARCGIIFLPVGNNKLTNGKIVFNYSDCIPIVETEEMGATQAEESRSYRA